MPYCDNQKNRRCRICSACGNIVPKGRPVMVQADWRESNPHSLAYIKNKPSGVGGGSGPGVDEIYTREQIDARFLTKEQLKQLYFSKAEANGMFVRKGDLFLAFEALAKGFYTKEQVDQLFTNAGASWSFLSGVNRVTSLSGLPVTKRTVVATLSGASPLSLNGELGVGQRMHVLCFPSSDFGQIMPTSSSFIPIGRSLVEVKKDTPFEIVVWCYDSGKYVLSVYDGSFASGGAQPSERTVSINTGHLSMTVGDTYQLTATTNPAGLTVKWASTDINAAKVDQTGLVTAIATGGATIMASVDVGGETKTASCAVLVQAKKIPVTKVTLSEESGTIRVGDTVRLTATVEPSDATNPDVSWSSTKESVAEVDASGLVTAKGEGQATIIAQADGRFAYYSLNVLAASIPVQYINLSPLTLRTRIGEIVSFTASVYPEFATQKTLSWQLSDLSKGEFVEASDTGAKVIAKSAGMLSVIVSSGGKSRVAEVTITEAVVPVSSVLLSKNISELFEGESERLIATVLPSNATNPTVTWSSTNESVAKVDQTGLVTAIAKGEASVKADCGGKSSTCAYMVKQKQQTIIEVQSVSLSEGSLELTKGGTAVLEVTVLPSNATNPTVTWSSTRPEVVAVDGYGRLFAKDVGGSVITATAGNKSATCQVSVKSNVIEVESITLNKNLSSLREGESERLVATVLPSNATNPTVTWSSTNESVAKVDQTGLVTAIATGDNVQIIARAGNRSSVCLYEKIEEAVVLASNITLSYSKNPPFKEGDNVQATAKVTPSHAHGADNLQWSSDNHRIADVSQTGLITCKKEGEATISVTCGTVTRSFQIEVEPLHKLLSVPAYIENYAYKNEIGKYDGLRGGSFFTGGLDGDTFEIPSHVTHIGSYAFASDKPNTRTFKGRLTVPQLGGVGNAAFLNCAAITSLVLKHGLTGVSAFGGCTGIKEVILGRENEFYVFNEFVFSGCRSLQRVTVPQGVTLHIRNGSFLNCESLKEFPFDQVRVFDPDASNNYSKRGCFMGCGFESVKWIVDVDIHEYTFFQNYKLRSVRVASSSSIRIEDYAFGDCDELQSVYIGRNVTAIGDFAFDNCWNPNLVIRIEGNTGRIPGAPWGAARARIEWT